MVANEHLSLSLSENGNKLQVNVCFPLSRRAETLNFFPSSLFLSLTVSCFLFSSVVAPHLYLKFHDIFYVYLPLDLNYDRFNDFSYMTIVKEHKSSDMRRNLNEKRLLMSFSFRWFIFSLLLFRFYIRLKFALLNW